jgi:hypothetical protein
MINPELIAGMFFLPCIFFILFFYCFLHIFPYCHVTIAVIFLQYYLNDTLNIVALLSFLGRNPVHDQS